MEPAGVADVPAAREDAGALAADAAADAAPLPNNAPNANRSPLHTRRASLPTPGAASFFRPRRDPSLQQGIGSVVYGALGVVAQLTAGTDVEPLAPSTLPAGAADAGCFCALRLLKADFINP